MNGQILYKKVYNGILEKIKSGEYKRGDFLPSQNILAKEYGVSLITIKKALEYAEGKGAVIRKQGRKAQIGNIDLKSSNIKVLLLIITGENRDSIKIAESRDSKIYLNIQNSWISIITNALLEELPENTEFLSAAYYYDQVMNDYDNTVIPKYDRVLLFGSRSQKLIDFLNNKGKKIAVFGTTRAKNCAIVSNNDCEISRRAVKYLISLGHKKIAFIGTNSEEGDFSERYKGYLEALKSNDLTVNGFFVRWCKSATSNEGYNMMKDILISSFYNDYRPTAIFCGNDNLAYGALMAINDYGLQCPKDISLIGVDNCLEICEQTTPQLSSVDKNFKSAGKQLANIISRAQWENTSITIKGSIVIRDSVKEID